MRNRPTLPRLSVVLSTSLVFLLVVSGVSYADSDRIANGDCTEDVFRFNVSPNGYPPYLIVQEDGQSGIMWEVVTRIADRMDFTVTAEKVPRKRVDQMLLDGYIDGTPRAREWTDQPDKYLFTNPVVEIEEVFFVPADSPLEYESPEDLHGKTLVAHLGYLYPSIEPHFDSGAIKRFDVSRDKDMFNYLLHGDRFDAAIADRLVGQWILKNEDLQDKFRISGNSISDFGFRLMVRQECESFVKQFNRQLEQLKQSGELEEILSNYR